LKRLKTILQYDEVEGLLLYSLLPPLFILLSFEYPLLIIISIFILFILYKKNRSLFAYSLFISIFLFLTYIFNYIISTKVDIKDYYIGIVSEKSDNYFILKKGLYRIKVYSKKLDLIEIGNKVKISGNVYVINERNVENSFSYYKYKLSKKIYFEYIEKDIEVIKKGFNIYRIRNFLIKYIENNYRENSIMYLKRLVLGISDFSEELDESINDTGIIFLFAISGLHINLLKDIIKKILRFLNLEEELISIVLIIFLFLYMVIAIESVSIFRSILMIIIVETISLFNKRIERIDTLSISFVMVLFINPFYIFQTGFYLTFISTLIIFLLKEKNFVKLSFSIILFTTPLLLFKNHEISIFIIVNSILFSLIFSYVFIPFTYLVIIFPFFDFIYNILIDIINKLIYIFSEINLTINFSITNIYFLLLTYFSLLVFFILIENKRGRLFSLLNLVFILLLNILSGIYRINPTMEVIDVGQGDSILLRSGFKVILIDTGELDKYSTTINYLKSMNINKIDYLFITHEDSDHFGEYEKIIESFKIKNIINQINDYNLQVGKIKIKTIRYDLENVNDSSMILYVEINDKKILLSADIENAGEKELIKEDISNIDYLKVAHHGSSSSSSLELIKKLNPKISLISVGLNNSYGHPNDEVIERLSIYSSSIYRTDYYGSIKIKFYKKFEIIKNHRSDSIFFFKNKIYKVNK